MTQRCPRHNSAWLSTVPDRAQLVSAVSGTALTALSWTALRPEQCSAQGWEFAHSHIRTFAHFVKWNEQPWAICSDRSRQMSDREQIAQVAQRKWATVSESLRLLRGNERPWANRSGRSEEMSDREQIAQVAQDKWATVTDSLRSLMINERLSVLLKKCLAKKI